MKVGLSFDIENFQWAARAGGGDDARATVALVEQVTRLLALLEERRIRATFFVVGDLFARSPLLARRIHAAGHEIGIHGDEHSPLHGRTPTAVRRGLADTVKRVEDVCGVRVAGYRAPFFSLSATTSWILDLLQELGFTYDASMLPVAWKRFGALPVSHRVLRLPGGLYEVPLTVTPFAGIPWFPCGGGGFRYLPYALSRRALARQLRAHGHASIFFHNYEVSSSRIEVAHSPPGALVRNPLLWARMFLCARSCGPGSAAKIQRLLGEFDCCRLSDLLPDDAAPIARSIPGQAR